MSCKWRNVSVWYRQMVAEFLREIHNPTPDCAIWWTWVEEEGALSLLPAPVAVFLDWTTKLRSWSLVKASTTHTLLPQAA